MDFALANNVSIEDFCWLPELERFFLREFKPNDQPFVEVTTVEHFT